MHDINRGLGMPDVPLIAGTAVILVKSAGTILKGKTSLRLSPGSSTM